MGVSWPRQPWSNFGLHNTHGFPTRKVFYGYLSRVNVCKPTFWRSLLSQHAYSGFSGFRIAAINLFQVDLDKPLNYLWYCYEKQWCWRWECKQWCWRSHQKRSSWSLWEKLPKKLFGQVWGNSGKNPSHSQKFACSYTYDEKTPQPPLPPFWKVGGGNAPCHASILRRPCA